MIAALYVEKNGTYFNIPDIDPWDESRDARKYCGPYPVIAHPPCARWSMLAGLVEARHGYKKGDDGGCFQSALNAVRKFGGIIEHPAYSAAWKFFDLPRPNRNGGWAGNDEQGYSCHVEQIKYGHVARKATWLYVFGISKKDLPELKWGCVSANEAKVLVSWCKNRVKSTDSRKRISKKAASKTPIEFRNMLLDLVKKVNQSNKIDLGKKVIDLKAWSWMPGMLAIFLPSLNNSPIKDRVIESSVNEFNESNKYKNWIPDLNDPATTGCLLELVRKASGSPFAVTEHHPASNNGVIWRMRTFNKSIEFGCYHNEVDVLVDALEYFGNYQ
jgi:hypothetical protein